MTRRITLKEALEAWKTQSASDEGAAGAHIPASVLYNLLIQPSQNGKKSTFLDHLTRCLRCLQEFKEIAQSIEEAEALDVAMPRAAATEMQWPKKIPAEGGKYVIEIRRYLGKENQSVFTVKKVEFLNG